MASDGAKLLARGSEVVLADGVPRRLILDMEALLVIEERVGSISAYRTGLILGFRGKVLKSVLAGLIGGLAHLQGEAALTPQQITGLMRGGNKDVQSYIDALDAAWDEAIPLPTPKATPGKGSGAASTSPGPSSSGASRSTTAARRRSSGE